MSGPMIGLIGIMVLIVLIFLKMPIGFSMLIVGFAGFAAITGPAGAFNNLSAIPFRNVTDYTFVVIPLFTLMGNIAGNTGISRDLYATAHRWVGHIRGGLAMASVLAAAMFAAITGSSTATATSVTKVAFPEMKRYKYDETMAAGCLSAGGTMGILIPPSMGFILYSVLTEESIGRLFMAGIIPGILEALFYIATIYFLCLRDISKGPPGPKTTFKEKIISLRGTWPMLVLFLLVMGGIYRGWFTPSEAAAIGASGALLISIIMRRINGKSFFESLSETASSTATIFIMIIGAMVFSRFIAVSLLPAALADFIAGLSVSKYFLLFLILVFYIFLGCFLDINASVVLTIPIIFPTIQALGFNAIWFGVLVVRVIEIGMITPPIGMNTFVVAEATGLPVSQVFKGIWPFFFADVVHVAMLVAFPVLSLFLVNMMM